MIKILIVDDEKGICDFVGDFFERRGHQVFKLTDPSNALAILNKEKPQIILLDILMPKLNGLELLRKIRQTNNLVKVIMVTVADDPSTREKAFNLGADDFVSKPFTLDSLESTVMTKIQELIES